MLSVTPTELKANCQDDANSSVTFIAARCGALLLTVLCGILIGCHQEEVSTQHSLSDGSAMNHLSPTVVSNGHERMREWLGQIAEDARHNNPIVGDRTASEFRSIVDLPGYLDRLPPDRKWKLLYDLGERELRLGNEADAIQRLTASLDAADSTSAPARYRKLSHFRLGIAYLRFAETQNCCQRNTPDSCIVPIQGEGIHQRKEGSQKAMQHLIAALRSAADANSDEDRLSVDETAKWLLNVAAMTLGTYPDAVPEEFRIPEQFFRSSVDFPRFRNVYPDLGLTTFNLCGGVVVDDLDGDLDLDIITCTWDPGGPTQVFRNNADGSFTEVTEGSGLEGFYGGLNMNQADFDNDGDLDIFIMRGA